MQRVTMGLEDSHIAYVEKIKRRFNTRSKAGAVGTALSIASTISDELEAGNEILLRDPSGGVKKLVFTGFHK